MAKATRPHGKTRRPSEKDTTTFSTRLDPEQKQRIEQAAELRGWSPSHLIRLAALEKAAHIINTSTARKFDFRGLTEAVGNQLVKPRIWIEAWSEDDPDEASTQIEEPGFPLNGEEFSICRLFPHREKFSSDQVLKLKQAARLGGTEFLRGVIEYCEGVTSPERKDLPEPIEPE